MFISVIGTGGQRSDLRSHVLNTLLKRWSELSSDPHVVVTGVRGWRKVCRPKLSATSTGTVEGVLIASITVWYGHSTAQDMKATPARPVAICKKFTYRTLSEIECNNVWCCDNHLTRAGEEEQ